MGVVVAATHLAVHNRVALKFVRPAAHAEGHKGAGDFTLRFLREAQAAGRLNSEHVARIYDAGALEDGTPYIAMEYLDGHDLGRTVESDAPIAVPDAVEYVLQACEALVEAHSHGIVHRDLKPQNLFLCRRLNGMPRVKVLDFGIAKEIGGSAQKVLTDSTVVLGSPLYMSPEQMRGAREADPRSDIWSLGVILHQLLARELPFDANTVPELCVKVMTEPHPKLADIRPHVPPELSEIVSRCLEKDVSRRWSSVAEFAAKLEPFSRSAERGVVDRPWRSFVDTIDSGAVEPSSGALAPGGVSGSGAVAASTGPKLSADTGVTWGEVSGAKSPSPPRRRSFFVGAVAGTLLTAAVVVAAMYAREDGTKLPSKTSGTASEPPVTSAVALSAAPSAPSAPSSSPAPSSTTVSPPPSASPSSHGKPPAPPPSARGTAAPKSTAAPAPTAPPAAASTARQGANGAPILPP